MHSPSIPDTVTRHCKPWQEFIEVASWSAEDTYVAIMTYSHDLDIKILEQVVRKETGYLGQIGSKAKWKEFQKHLVDKGISSARIAEIHCPIGLPVGGKAPKEIGISVASEILKVYYGR